MNIAIAVSTFPPYRGGMGNLAAHHARLLVQGGHDVTVYAPTSNESKTEQRDGYTVKFLHSPITIGNAAILPRLFGLSRNADIVFLHVPFIGGATPLALGKRMHGGKLIVYYHMDLVGIPPRDKIFKLYSQTFLPWIIRSADRIAVSSVDYAMTGNLAHIWQSLPPERLVELPPSVDAEQFSPGEPKSETGEGLLLKPETPIVLFVGGLDKAHYFKGLEFLLRAVAHVHQSNIPCQLLVVGDGDLRGHYETMAHSLGIIDSVRFAGSVGPGSLTEMYRLADIFCLPSVDRSEAFGLVLMEAGAVGKPVIASRLPGVRILVKEGETGILVEPANVQELASAIGFLVKDPESALKMGEAGRRRMQNNYNEEKLASGLNELVRDLF